eukprot:Seg1958.4 transcript_id=Seg1958.4/GoldUCD/mRNA.D3Y31 product="Hydroxyacyl-coenzyme A dehydrogenase mitochondrial" protein_id=Seg1958.4/GoldUCD/D3Y31
MFINKCFRQFGQQPSIQRSRLLLGSFIDKRSAHVGTTTPVERHEEIRNVVVVGAGSMGSGIALDAARNDFNVVVVDRDASQLTSCMNLVKRGLERIVTKKFPEEPRMAKKFSEDTIRNILTSTDAMMAVQNADIVIEAISEDLQAKRSLFADLDEAAPKKTLFASNTSSLPISKIAAATKREDKFGGLHFNPVLMMQLVEVIRCPYTSNSTYKKLYQFGKDLGKTPVSCKDTTAFVVNRLLVPYILEGIRLVERGHATLKDIDHAMRLGAGHDHGPFELADELGLDLIKSIADELNSQFPKGGVFQSPDTLNRLVAEGKLGWKSEEGFYSYHKTGHN